MARPLRHEYPGATYHVIVRGNRRDTIFVDDEDRLRFLSDLERVVARYGWTFERFVESDGDDLVWDPLGGRSIMGGSAFVGHHAERQLTPQRGHWVLWFMRHSR